MFLSVNEYKIVIRVIILTTILYYIPKLNKFE